MYIFTIGTYKYNPSYFNKVKRLKNILREKKDIVFLQFQIKYNNNRQIMDIFVVGASNMDLVSYMSRFPKEGETLHGTKFETGFGGKGANQAVMTAKLGGKVGMLSCVGDDSFGTDTIKNYKDNGVDCKHVHQISNMATGVAPIFVNENGENCIVIVNGANDLVTKQHVHNAKEEISQSQFVVCQLEIPVEISLEALKVAREVGTKSIFNPAPARSDLPSEMFSLCDIITPNEPEAELLTGEKVDSTEGAITAAKKLIQKGCGMVLMTLGSRGCLLLESEDSEPSFIPVPQQDVTVKDTSGAGDCFIGSLSFFLAKGMPIKEACSRACYCASISVQSNGTQSSYPNKDQIPKEMLGSL